MATKTTDKPVISPSERAEFDSMTSSENFSKNGAEPQSVNQNYISKGLNALEAHANKGAPGQPQRGGLAKRYGQQFAGGARGAVAGAAKGAAKEGIKEGAKTAAKWGAKGASKGAQMGARTGYAAPIAVPLGAALGAGVGASAGAAVGGAKGSVKGGFKGAQKGAEDGIRKVREKQRNQEQGKKDAGLMKKGMQGLAKKVGKTAGKQLGRATGVGDVAEQAKDIKAMAKGPFNKEARKAAINTANRVAANTAALAAMGNKELAPLIQKGLEVVENKKFWLYSALLLLFIGLIIFMLFDAVTFDPDNNIAVTASDNCVPAQFTGDAFGKTAVCTITVTSPGMASDVTITDTILPGTQFVSAGQKGTYDKTANTVTWDASQLGLALNPINITVTVTIRITTHNKNTTVYNAYSVNPTGLAAADSSGGASAVSGNLPSNANTCSGVYAHYMSITPGHQNYGDPSCALVKKDPNGTAIINKDLILSQLKSIKPSEAMGWFICVVPNESGYNANAYLGASTSGNGAYGLVQMNPTGKGNGQYDDGEVNWNNQLSNGINYNDKVIGHTFSYWPTSYDSCLRSYGVTVN